ncbi:MAG: alpha/beta fold hydrolase [Chloroflexi bacterium]|nr:alpha/beta fold hydrolase [Chloroflexota bacterium]
MTQDDIAILHPCISGRLFFPQFYPFKNPFEVRVDGATLACSFHQFSKHYKTVVFFHGNGETVGEYDTLFPRLFESLSLNLFLAEYRGYGLSTGDPDLLNLVSDVAPIIEAVGQPQENIILFGRSLGSLPAIHAASLFPSCHGLIVESGTALLLDNLIRWVPSLLDVVARNRLAEEINLHFDHRKKLGAFRGGCLVVHSLNDRMTPVSHGRMIHDWVSAPKRLALFERGDHNSIFLENWSTYIGLIVMLAEGRIESEWLNNTPEPIVAKRAEGSV